MNYINEIALLIFVGLIFFTSFKIQGKIEVNRLFKIKIIVGVLLVSWIWIDPSGSIALSTLITASVISGLYNFYTKKIKKA